MAVDKNGDIFSFGYNKSGQLGLGDVERDGDVETDVFIGIPTKIKSLTNVKQSSCGENQTIVLLKNGDVYSFGNNTNGQLGLGHFDNQNVPVKNSLTKVKQISCGATHAMVLLVNGIVYSFGNNTNGQLGVGTVENQYTPTIIPSLSKNVKQISCGFHHSMVLMDNGDVYTFGRSEYGQLGLGDIQGSILPINLLPLKRVKQISSGANYSYVLLESGDIYSFGFNSSGQLGLGHFDNQKVPAKVKF